MTTTEEPLQRSVSGLIRHVLDTSSLSTAREVAAKVAENTPRDELYELYAQALVPLVSDTLRARRNTALDQAQKVRPVTSAKVAGIRDHWAELCASRLHVGGGVWLTMGEARAEHLAYAAEERRRDAERELTRAGTYDRLLAALGEHGVATVGELPADVLATAGTA